MILSEITPTDDNRDAFPSMAWGRDSAGLPAWMECTTEQGQPYVDIGTQADGVAIRHEDFARMVWELRHWFMPLWERFEAEQGEQES